MDSLPAPRLRANVGTWAVPVALLPAVTKCLLESLLPEPFDAGFAGQDLDTTYFDAPNFDLRKARLRKDRYLTLRIRRYAQTSRPDAYALSAKTEAAKFRADVPAALAIAALRNPSALAALLQAALPADLLARLLDLAGAADLAAVTMVCCRRNAVEDDRDRFTLDVAVQTDLSKTLPFTVLEFKSSSASRTHANWPGIMGLRPIKLSKFLWATGS